MHNVLQLDPRDNVLIALTDLQRGEKVEHSGKQYTLVAGVPAKHKFATEDLPTGASVTMYGVLVGKILRPVRRGELLTTANVHHEAAEYHERAGEYHWNAPNTSRWKQGKFMGYRRSDGQVGTRNFWLVVPLVFCENRNILNLKQAFEEELGFARPQLYRQQVAELVRQYGEGKPALIKHRPAQEKGQQADSRRVFRNVDGIKFLLHEGGCGGTREDSNNLCGLIAGYVHHPNVAGATVLSLGCQNAQIEILWNQLQRRNPKFEKPLIILEQQKSGSEFAMLSDAIQKTFEGLVEADKATRSPAELSHLCAGLKCGGSDGFSGISANPAIGHTSDLLVALGATTILSEFPSCAVWSRNSLTAPSLEKLRTDSFGSCGSTKNVRVPCGRVSR
jgi:altronate hydrolase